ncbi:MAG: cyclic nucleotide-binding protein [Bacteroidetes bacterium]|nr:MAG: cyclic nucleotide-binding protein [Bacteroidota bacterium]PTM12942.1 MAG: cyclic nucleotide-binding protein [Bacteroidota bacterium]
MALNQLFAYFDPYLPLTAAEKDELGRRAKTRKIKRRQFVLQENDVCRHYTFVVEGCLKMYLVDEQGKEHNLQFAAENDWIADIGSFHTEQPSQLYLEALEPTQIIQLEKPDLLYLYTHYPTFDRNFRVLIEDQYVALQRRLLQQISAPAEERYRSFLAQYPQLAARLPNTQIASYLGITPEFLSKVRKALSRK